MAGDRCTTRHFVGREREEALVDALLADDAAERVIHVRGPAGMGKTALLQAWAWRARGRGHLLGWIDAASLPPSRGAAWEATTSVEHELRILGVVGPAPPQGPRAPEWFRKAVMGALRRLRDPRFEAPPALGELEVVRRRAERAGLGPSGALHELLVEQCHMFDAAPLDREISRVVHRTYLSAARQQKEIAAELGMSFSAYRRHLGAGVRRMAEALWVLEQHGDPSGD